MTIRWFPSSCAVRAFSAIFLFASQSLACISISFVLVPIANSCQSHLWGHGPTRCMARVRYAASTQYINRRHIYRPDSGSILLPFLLFCSKTFWHRISSCRSGSMLHSQMPPLLHPPSPPFAPSSDVRRLVADILKEKRKVISWGVSMRVHDPSQSFEYDWFIPVALRSDMKQQSKWSWPVN